MEYSFAEGLLLTVSEVAIDLYHTMRERPRTFWGAWALVFGLAALLLLRPGRPQTREL